MSRLVVPICSIAVATMVAGILVVAGTSDSGLRLALRSTALTSLGLFLAAFTASSINRLWRGGRVGRWLLRNRRALGVSFAVSHFIHLGLIAARAATQSDAFWTGRSPSGMVPGAITYAFILAMTVTSFDRPTRWLGRKRWKVLHKVGVYVIWGLFVSALASRVRAHPEAVALLALLGAAYLVRLAAFFARRRAH